MSQAPDEHILDVSHDTAGITSSSDYHMIPQVSHDSKDITSFGLFKALLNSITDTDSTMSNSNGNNNMSAGEKSNRSNSTYMMLYRKYHIIRKLQETTTLINLLTDRYVQKILFVLHKCGAANMFFIIDRTNMSHITATRKLNALMSYGIVTLVHPTPKELFRDGKYPEVLCIYKTQKELKPKTRNTVGYYIIADKMNELMPMFVYEFEKSMDKEQISKMEDIEQTMVEKMEEVKEITDEAKERKTSEEAQQKIKETKDKIEHIAQVYFNPFWRKICDGKITDANKHEELFNAVLGEVKNRNDENVTKSFIEHWERTKIRLLPGIIKRWEVER